MIGGVEWWHLALAFVGVAAGLVILAMRPRALRRSAEDEQDAQTEKKIQARLWKAYNRKLRRPKRNRRPRKRRSP